MATEYPPLGKSFVLAYANNDRDYPIVAIRKDPRVENYKIPDDLSPHPDSKRWPNHVFTGAQPTNSDERVQWVYEILPSPYVPFTRYDDDLGPVQGRRRSVKNEGQVASLNSSTRTTYEARDGSAIVSNEIEESWSIKTDNDGNSLFPIRDRDFYDPSRGPVQERRQLFVPAGEEEASLENADGVITQTSYEPYNEFLSFKVVQTYKVSGPQLIGKATNNEGQLTTVTTQRKGSLNYIPPNPTALRTVEASREDAESLVERIIDIPEVFKATTISVERPDPVPQKFRVNIPSETTQSNVEGIASVPSLSSDDLSKSEQQVTEFVKRISTTSRDSINEASLSGEVYTSELGGGIATVTEKYGSSPEIDPDTGTVSAEKENLGNDKFYTREVKLTTPLPELKGQDYDDTFDITIPFTRQFVEAGTEAPTNPSSIEPRDTLHSINNTIDIEAAKERLLDVLYVTGDRQSVQLPDVLTDITLYVDYATEGDNANSTGSSATAAATVGVNAGVDLLYNIKDGYNGPADAQRYLFFLPKEQCGITEILSKLDNTIRWPVIRPRSERVLVRFTTERKFVSFQLSLPNNRSISTSTNKTPQTVIFPIPATLHGNIQIDTRTQGSSSIGPVSIGVTSPVHGSIGTSVEAEATLGETVSTIEATSPESFPTGRFLYSVNTTPYRFGLVRVEAIVVEITQEMVA